ncbi:cation diffusion facilitator family transporter [Methylotenera sp. G11]|uniref:cation diffusion facilitator family transporter n=1 Tax=Methylotenera sp. G11 TaxID=1506585 RepID=UPI000648FF07|nr:cation diffusion facilitator family transporter [Methylotenera sp. G11]
MADCCENKACALEAMKVKQSKILKIVLLINIFLFCLTAFYGWAANSTGLMSESIDDFGDAVTYALSLYVVYKSNQVKAKVAFVKGCLILLGALFVLSQVVLHLIDNTVPVFETMGAVAFVALLLNFSCYFLLTKYREQDINMRSVWECSRNDILNNVAIMVASILVWITNLGWADIAVGLVLSVMLLGSSFRVLKASYSQMRSK